MKVKREDCRRKMESFTDMKREILGRSWHRAEDRMQASLGPKRAGVRESPRKKNMREQVDLRNKIRSMKPFTDKIDNDQVTFATPRTTSRRELETDENILIRREKQISYGKNTVDYDRYSTLVPKDERTEGMPTTPKKQFKYSRRQWDGLVRIWKQKIHSTVSDIEAGNTEINVKDEDRRRVKDEDPDIKEEEPDFEIESECFVGSSWADEMEEEYGSRCRTESSASSDQGLGHSSVSSMGDVASGRNSPADDFCMKTEKVRAADEYYELTLTSNDDFIDA